MASALFQRRFIRFLDAMLIDTQWHKLGSGKPRASQGVGQVAGAPLLKGNENSFGLFRNGFRSGARRQFSERSGRHFIDNYRRRLFSH